MQGRLQQRVRLSARTLSPHSQFRCRMTSVLCLSLYSYISQCKGNDLHEAIERQKVQLRKIVADPGAELPLTMECVARMRDFDCVGGQTGAEAEMLHTDKVPPHHNLPLH